MMLALLAFRFGFMDKEEGRFESWLVGSLMLAVKEEEVERARLYIGKVDIK